MLDHIHWATALVTVAAVGTIFFACFMLWLGIRLARRPLISELDSTELSDRNIPVPKFDPPYLVWEKK